MFTQNMCIRFMSWSVYFTLIVIYSMVKFVWFNRS